MASLHTHPESRRTDDLSFFMKNKSHLNSGHKVFSFMSSSNSSHIRNLDDITDTQLCFLPSKPICVVKINQLQIISKHVCLLEIARRLFVL